MVQQSTNSNDKGERKRLLGYVQIALIIGVIVVAIVFARAPGKVERTLSTSSGTEQIKPAVSVVKPQAVDIALPVKLTGNVSLEERVTVTSEAKGRVAWISEKFKTGRTIPANEVFVKIDPTEYSLLVKEAEAMLQLGGSQQESENSSDSAARTKLLKARLELAQHRLAQTEISLPYDVRVIASDIEVGELVGPHEYVGKDASKLGTVFRPEALQVGAPVEPHILQQMNPLIGRDAEVNIAGKTYKATIDRVSPLVARNTRLRRIFLKFTNDDASESLPLPGMFAEIRLAGPSLQNVYILPQSVQQLNESVWIVNDGVLNSFSPNPISHTEHGWVVEAFDAAAGIVTGTFRGAAEGVEVTISN